MHNWNMRAQNSKNFILIQSVAKILRQESHNDQEFIFDIFLCCFDKPINSWLPVTSKYVGVII